MVKAKKQRGMSRARRFAIAKRLDEIGVERDALMEERYKLEAEVHAAYPTMTAVGRVLRWVLTFGG